MTDSQTRHENDARPTPEADRENRPCQRTEDAQAPTPSKAHEPRALRDWDWRNDPHTRTNPLSREDGRGGSGYVRLRKNDLVWTGRNSGRAPVARSDGIPWRFGLNLRTARSGWFPCDFATKPAQQFLCPLMQAEQHRDARNAGASTTSEGPNQSPNTSPG